MKKKQTYENFCVFFYNNVTFTNIDDVYNEKENRQILRIYFSFRNKRNNEIFSNSSVIVNNYKKKEKRQRITDERVYEKDKLTIKKLREATIV